MKTSEMISLFGEFVLNIIKYLVDKQDDHWNIKWYWRVSQAVGPELKLKSYSKKKPFWTLKYESCFVGETVIEDLADRTTQKQ